MYIYLYTYIVYICICSGICILVYYFGDIVSGRYFIAVSTINKHLILFVHLYSRITTNIIWCVWHIAYIRYIPCLQDLCGFPMVFLLVFLCCSHGLMVFVCFPHGSLMVVRWFSYSVLIVLLWFSYCFPIVLILIVLLLCPQCFWMFVFWFSHCCHIVFPINSLLCSYSFLIVFL